MELNFFKTVGDYPKMLNKIALSTFVGSILGVWLLRHEFSSIDNALCPFSIPAKLLGDVALPLGTIVPAFLLALISRIFKLHDRLSDIFRIRQRFDVSEILFPLAIVSGANLSGNQVRSIKQHRESMMYKVFYKYASSTSGKSVIDGHYITMALDQWCWYWIIVELAFLSFILGGVFLVAARYLLAAIFLAVVLGSIGLLQFVRSFCSDYALQEVEAILETPERKLEVAEVFRAL